MQRLANVRVAPVVFAAAVCALAASGAAQEGDAPPVPLDRLLELPSSAGAGAEVEKRGGSTRAQWLERFRAAREEVASIRRDLEATRAELEELSGESDAWRMSAPGIGAPVEAGDAPLDYQLSQQLRRQRAELARAERRLQDLEVEANLVGVPLDWRGEPEGEAGAGEAADAAPETSSGAAADEGAAGEVRPGAAAGEGPAEAAPRGP